MLAVTGILFVSQTMAIGAAAMVVSARFLDHAGTDDTRRDSQDGVAKEHDNGREETSHGGDGGDVTVSYGGHGDDGPVDAGGDVGELGVGLSVLDHEHQGADADDQYHDKKEVNQYLVGTMLKGAQQHVALGQEIEQFEDAEHSDEAERPQDDGKAGIAEEEAQIHGQDAQQIDNAKEAFGVSLGSWRTVEAGEVLHREEDGEEILQHHQCHL